MYSSNLFGNFYPVESKVHNINVIIKLFDFLIFLLIMYFSKNFIIHVFILVILLLQMIESNVPMKFYFNMFYGLRYIYLLLIFIFAFSNLTLNTSLLYLLKVIMVILNLTLLTFTTSSCEFDYGLYKILNPINFLNLDISKISNFILNLIEFIPLMILTEKKILDNQASRGIDYFQSGIVGKVYALLNSFKNTLRLSVENMKLRIELSKLRLNEIKGKRYLIYDKKINFYSILILFFHILFLVLYIVEIKVL